MGFRKGDKVICIDIYNGGHPTSLTFGKAYDIIYGDEIDLDYIQIINDMNVKATYISDRFVDLKVYRTNVIDNILM